MEEAFALDSLWFCNVVVANLLRSRFSGHVTVRRMLFGCVALRMIATNAAYFLCMKGVLPYLITGLRCLI